MLRVAFLGLGNMGAPMALNLVARKYDVIGFDVQQSSRASFTAAGGQAAAHLADAIEDANLVITMLPSGRELKSIYLGEHSLIEKIKAGALLIDCSTIDVPTTRKVAHAAEQRGLAMVDAPVSGGTMGAKNGTLTFMVGGTDLAFLRAEPLLTAMGKNIIHCGQIGAGQAAKTCNNAILGVSMAAVSEAFALADSLGLAREKLFEVASTSSGQCWALTSYCPVPGPVPTSPANGDYAPGFAASMMLKDLRLAVDAAHAHGVPTAAISQAAELYALMVARGMGGLDFSGLFQFIEPNGPKK
jgi:3-hydroxyisobutyrate dehydrogenase